MGRAAPSGYVRVVGDGGTQQGPDEMRWAGVLCRGLTREGVDGGEQPFHHTATFQSQLAYVRVVSDDGTDLWAGKADRGARDLACF